MKVEDPNALRFILQDDLYLLDEEKYNYNNHIPKPQPEIETPQLDFNYWGTNKKSFLILVNYPAHEFIADDHLAALENVLNRKGYSRDDVALLNTAKHTDVYDVIAAYFKPKTLLILGKSAMPEGVKGVTFNLPGDHQGAKVLYTFSFDEMMTNTDNKKAFWDQVKTL